MFSKDRPLLWAFSFLSLLVCLWVIWDQAAPPYQAYQQEFRALIEERFGPERAAATPMGLQQVWLEEARRVDRCTSCHLGVTWEGLGNAPQPFSSHPPGYLDKHPVEDFGCTLCHGGQGFATRLPDAHGWVAHWEDPLLDSQLGKDYRMQDEWTFTQIKCNTCHRYDKQTEGAEQINKGKRLIRDKGCRACHVINERGGSIGPDLTFVGDKSPEHYDYSRLTTIPSFFSWQVAHLQKPKSYSPDTVMPDFGFNSEEARSIGLLLMSWKDVELPLEMYPGGVIRDIPTEEELERERMMMEGEGRFFVENTCFICHDVSSLGVESATKIGPDLALAVEDAPRRFGRTLESFLLNPTGTMQVVLSKQIELSREERLEAVRLLEIAYERYQAQQAESQEEN
ncbi:MAG TPA: c-type cytochrome [Acidobacteriota bacterium]|nr:c-type cytochrome [Acidobacteriota bacterium]